MLTRFSADYRDIDPRYGTLEDWDRLKDAIHARGMKIMSVASLFAVQSLICFFQNGPRG